MTMLTTGDCARILNAACESPDGFTAAFILAEVDEGSLHARVNDQRKSRRRVRIHPEDFVIYLSKRHARVLERALQHPDLSDVPRGTDNQLAS